MGGVIHTSPNSNDLKVIVLALMEFELVSYITGQLVNITNIISHGIYYGSLEPKRYSVDFSINLFFYLDYLVINFSLSLSLSLSLCIYIYIYIYIYIALLAGIEECTDCTFAEG